MSLLAGNPVVVVGHGKSPMGMGWGRYIDGCGTVIRMWNWAWQLSHLGDYGQHYDYGMYEVSGTEMARMNKYNYIFPVEGWVATELHSNVGDKEYKGPPPPGITNLVSSEPWEDEGKRLGGLGLKGRLVLTRGVRAACWAIDNMEPNQMLILVGFDNVYAGKTLSISEGFHPTFVPYPAAFPFRDYDTAAGKTKYGNHDYAVEGPLLQSWANRRRVVLVHAQEIWV